jgi:hypothetical protein
MTEASIRAQTQKKGSQVLVHSRGTAVQQQVQYWGGRRGMQQVGGCNQLVWSRHTALVGVQIMNICYMFHRCMSESIDSGGWAP